MNNDDKLTNILNKCYEQFGDPPMLSQEEAHSAICDLFKSLVPEEKKDFSGSDDNWVGQQSGFNDCRKEILENIERMRNEPR